MRDMERREAVVRRVGRIERTQAPHRESLSDHVDWPRRFRWVDHEEEEVRGDPDQQIREDRAADQLILAHDEDGKHDQKQIERPVDQRPERHQR
jgi:hypothetical protein